MDQVVYGLGPSLIGTDVRKQGSVELEIETIYYNINFLHEIGIHS